MLARRERNCEQAGSEIASEKREKTRARSKQKREREASKNASVKRAKCERDASDNVSETQERDASEKRAKTRARSEQNCEREAGENASEKLEKMPAKSRREALAYLSVMLTLCLAHSLPCSLFLSHINFLAPPSLSVSLSLCLSLCLSLSLSLSLFLSPSLSLFFSARPCFPELLLYFLSQVCLFFFNRENFF